MRAHWVTPVIRLLLLALLFAAAVSPKTRHRKRRSKSSLDAAAHFDEQLGEVFGDPSHRISKFPSLRVFRVSAARLGPRDTSVDRVVRCDVVGTGHSTRDETRTLSTTSQLS